MPHEIQIEIGQDAIQKFVEYCQAHDTTRYTLVADTNTYPAMGAEVEAALKNAGFEVVTIVLTGDEVIADEKYLMQTLVQAPTGDQTFVAVGSGTITDIARYISFRTRNPFISVPTAPSVDGFVSIGAPLVIGGVKQTYNSQGPLATFADINCLMKAPGELRAAGFGDMIGKTTSLADWQLGRLLWNEPFDAEIEQRTRKALNGCIEATAEIARGSEPGIRLLIDGLIESGLCMLDVGNSRPASGCEHHCSHYWEMQLLKQGKPAILHGAKVGYATTLLTQLYDRIRSLSQDDARQLVARAPFPEPERTIEEIKRAYGAAADEIIHIQRPFLELTKPAYEQLQARIVDHWSDIQAIAATVLPADRVKDVLGRVGAPTGWESLGLDRQVVLPGVFYGHYLRNRFTVVKLCKTLGIDVTPSL